MADQKQHEIIVAIRLWWHRYRLSRKLAFGLATAAVFSGLATVATMTGGSTRPDPDTDTVLALLYLDATLLLLLSIVVARRMVGIFIERRRGQAGSGLHTRLVVMFGLVAVSPAILVAIFSTLFLNFGIQTWFSDRIQEALEASNAVATAYLHEHQQNIRADALATANDLNNESAALMRNPKLFNSYLTTQAGLRSFPEAIVIDSNGKVLARSTFSQALEFGLVPSQALAEAAEGKIIVLTAESDDRVRALVRLGRFVDAYLLIGRFVDPQVLAHIERTRGAVAKYKRLEEKQGGIQITFVMIFGIVTLMLLLAAIWVGLTLAGQLSRPISRLIQASEKVREGELDVRVEESTGTDEIGSLGRAFNRMTSQLQSQQQGLMDANRQLDERRRFTETVLSGVSAGVIGLDSNGRIHLPNRSASDLIGIDIEPNIGENLGSVIPAMSDLLARARKNPDRPHTNEIQIDRNGVPHTLIVNMAAEKLGGDVVGYVATFDDVTELLSAQRKAAWADVARRIAHEIKNPLTPIQLSAERLNRKYLKQIKDDPETFTACTDTIIRQVKDIGRMVDEFSSFARMPQAMLKMENMSDLCRHAVTLERNRHTDIGYDLNLSENEIIISCDSRQINQALTNLLKNAAESVQKRLEIDKGKGDRGWVCCSLKETLIDGVLKEVSIIVEDNGGGLPMQERSRLTEPYVTSRSGGTGLGLAIVKKIMEDHEGDLVLEDRKGGGASISLVLRPREDNKEIDQSEEAKKLSTEMVNHGS